MPMNYESGKVEDEDRAGDPDDEAKDTARAGVDGRLPRSRYECRQAGRRWRREQQVIEAEAG